MLNATKLVTVTVKPPLAVAETPECVHVILDGEGPLVKMISTNAWMVVPAVQRIHSVLMLTDHSYADATLVLPRQILGIVQVGLFIRALL